MIIIHNAKKIDIKRYPTTKNISLRAWNAADEYLLTELENHDLQDKKMLLYNDRFGFLSTLLHDYKPTNVFCYHTQIIACKKNLENNFISTNDVEFLDPLADYSEQVDVALIKIPKSLDLFRFFLQHLSKNVKKDSLVVCGFMTKYFSRQMLSIASEYFDSVDQGKAWKKSRLLYLKNPKPYKEIDIIKSVKFDDNISLAQYFGVFSSEKIDPATQFLIENITFDGTGENILDLGAGNGILTKIIAEKAPQNEFYLIDDSYLANESAKLNLSGENFHFYFENDLKIFDNCMFDFVISNPPFHFEHEINIEVSIGLFRQVARCLKNGGQFQLVGNQHLNYKTHLVKYFQEVNILAENEKYVIYQCIKNDIVEDQSELDEFNLNIDISDE